MNKTCSINKSKTTWGTVWKIRSKTSLFYFSMWIYDDDPDDIYLGDVFVNKIARGQGLGNQILKLSEEFAVEQGASQLRLKVSKNNTFAHKWYMRHGFEDMRYDKDEPIYMWMSKLV